MHWLLCVIYRRTIAVKDKYRQAPVKGTDSYQYIAILSSYVHSPRADSSGFGLRGSKVHQNGRFPVLDADVPPSKIWRR